MISSGFLTKFPLDIVKFRFVKLIMHTAASDPLISCAFHFFLILHCPNIVCPPI